MNYIATTTDPDVAVNIQRAYPGSYIVPQNGALHIYTNQSAAKNKPNKPKQKQTNRTSVLDRIPWYLLAIGILILLAAIS